VESVFCQAEPDLNLLHSVVSRGCTSQISTAGSRFHITDAHICCIRSYFPEISLGLA